MRNRNFRSNNKRYNNNYRRFNLNSFTRFNVHNVIVFGQILIAIAVVGMFFGYGCTVPVDKAEQALESMGYENIQVHGYALFSCDKKSIQRSYFTATKVFLSENGGRPRRVSVEGAICCGYGFHSCSVSF